MNYVVPETLSYESPRFDANPFRANSLQTNLLQLSVKLPIYHRWTCRNRPDELMGLKEIYSSTLDLIVANTMAGRKRRDSGPLAAPTESKGDASDIRPNAQSITKCVAIKEDPRLWELAKRTPTRALEKETNPEHRRNIEACLKYVTENGYPFPDEVFIAMDGVVEHVTEEEFWAMDWPSLADAGRKDEAFVMVSSCPSLPDFVLLLIGSHCL